MVIIVLPGLISRQFAPAILPVHRDIVQTVIKRNIVLENERRGSIRPKWGYDALFQFAVFSLTRRVYASHGPGLTWAHRD